MNKDELYIITYRYNYKRSGRCGEIINKYDNIEDAVTYANSILSILDKHYTRNPNYKFKDKFTIDKPHYYIHDSEFYPSINFKFQIELKRIVFNSVENIEKEILSNINQIK